MTPRSWIRNLLARTPRTLRKPPALFRPRLEVLEDRLAPAFLTVNSTADTAKPSDTYLSLRMAIDIVNSATLPTGLSSQIMGQISGTLHDGGTDTIAFDHSKVVTAITLGGTHLELSLPSTTATVMIDGGAGGVTVDGNNESRIFQVDSGAQATLANLTLTNGMNFIGAGIENLGTATVSSCTLSSNNAGMGGGGGIDNDGTLAVSNSTLSGNSASLGAGIDNLGTVTVTNSTFSGNNAITSGGGIFNADTATVSNCTLSGNNAVNGGAAGITNNDTLTLNNTIVANNSSGGDIDGSYTGSHNLTGTVALGNLQDNGGPTETMALQLGSSAIAGGDTSLLPSGATTDQRGFARIVNGNVDIGAYEVQLPTFSPATLPDGTYGTSYSQTITATEAGYSGTFTFINFPIPPRGMGVELENGSLIILHGTPTAAGSFSFTVTVQDSAGFQGSQVFNLTIDTAPLAVTPNSQNMTYGDSVPPLTYSYTGLVNGDQSASFTGSLATAATSSSNVGAYPITQGTLAATGNYSIGTFNNGVLTDNPAVLLVTAYSQTKIYGQIAFDSGTVSGVVNNDGITASFASAGDAATAPVGTGSYTITANLSDPNHQLSNYIVHETDATLTVHQATLTITANNATKIQGEANPTFTVSYIGFVNSQGSSVLGGTLTFITPATTSSGPGLYSITPSGLTSGNYAITFVPGTLTVISYSQATTNLQTTVDNAGLAHGIQSSFDTQLQSAIALFAAGDTADAASQLGAFINHVKAQSGKQIDAALADVWIAAAQRIINAVG